MIGVTLIWHVAQWVSRAPHHSLPAFTNLNCRTRPKRRINKYKFKIRFLKEISRSLNPLGFHSGAETMKIEISSSVILLECFKIQNSGKPIYDRMRKWNFRQYFWRLKEFNRSKVMKGTLRKSNHSEVDYLSLQNFSRILIELRYF